MYSLYLLIDRAIYFYETMIIVWCIMTYVPLRPGSVFNDIRNALGSLVCPYLNFFRRFIPPIGGLDFSPMIAIIALTVIERFLILMIF